MNAEQLLKHYERVADAPDAVARSRKLILALAMRGKLVPQKPEGEPAEFRLKVRGPAQGSRSAAGVNPICGAEYELPPRWEQTSLGAVSTIVMGQSPPGATYNASGDGVPLINGPVEFSEGPFGTTVVNQYTTAPTNFCEAGDLLICVRGSTTGRTNIAGFRACIGRGVAAIQPSASISSDYMKLFMWHSREYILSLGRGIAFPSVSRRQIEDLTLNLPPLAEQYRIVAKVDELMALCDRLEAARTQREATRDRLTASTLARLNTPEPLASPDGDASKESSFQSDARLALNVLPALTTRPDQIKQLRRTVFDLAVSGRLVAQTSDEEPFRDFLSRTQHDQNRRDAAPVRDVPAAFQGLPRSWQWTHLGDLVLTMDAGWSPQCDGEPRGSEAEWGVLKTTAVQALAYEPHQNKRLPEKLQPRPQHEAKIGDILVTRAGPKNRVGVSCVVDKPSPRLMISDKLIRFHTFDGIFPRYIALALNAGFTMECVERAKSGMAVMQMNISQDKLKLIPLPMPPLAEQHRIVAKVDELMSLCGQLEASLTLGQNTRSRLLNALLHEALAPAEFELEAA